MKRLLGSLILLIGLAAVSACIQPGAVVPSPEQLNVTVVATATSVVQPAAGSVPTATYGSPSRTPTTLTAVPTIGVPVTPGLAPPMAATTASPFAAPTAPLRPSPRPDVTIIIKDYAFGTGKDPVIVSPGTTVTWRNEDADAHTVTADDKSFDSGDMLQGAVFQHTFTKPGEFPYYCTWHGGPGGQYMSGRVIVR
jgi:plastocyanin